MTQETTYIIAHAGQYVRVTAPSEEKALESAKADYHMPPSLRLGDWKDSEYDGQGWEIMESTL